MDDSDFEGTLVLEQRAEVRQVEEFVEAVDADDVECCAIHPMDFGDEGSADRDIRKGEAKKLQ